MKMRLRTLWRVPVYCLIASWISFYATVYLARFFFVVKSVGADGVTNVSADPVRSTIFHAVLFLAVLLIGGLWAFRSMTRAEIAVSAAIMTAVYLSVVLFQLNQYCLLSFDSPDGPAEFLRYRGLLCAPSLHPLWPEESCVIPLLGLRIS